jgi:xylulokinase
VPLVAGIDSSTQACKVVIRDLDSGALVREGRAAHPAGGEVDPDDWWCAFGMACAEAGGLDDVAAISVAAQQHGCICLDERGRVVRPALLWNDTRSADAASELVDELGGPERGARAWADAVGSVPLASFTVAKLRWIAEHEPRHAERTAAVCLPHDWLTWRLAQRGAPLIDRLSTDRSDASGTGYFSPRENAYRADLLELAFGRSAKLPRVLEPAERAGVGETGAVLAPGMGDNAAAALALALDEGDVLVSIGTSGTVMSVTASATADASGLVAGFADATGRFLPLVCTLNAARVLDASARMLGVEHDELSRLALSAPAGAGGLVLLPYLDGERAPNLPHASGALHGLTHETATAAHIARASVEGLLCGLADGLDALEQNGVRARRVLLIGGGARSQALRRLAPAILGRPVVVPASGEYVADGAARQAAWTLAGTEQAPWPAPPSELCEAEPDEHVRGRYAEARELFLSRLPVRLRDA